MNALHRNFAGDGDWRHPRAETLPPAPAIPTVQFELAINDAIDGTSFAGNFATSGRIRIPGLLSAGAIALHDHLQASSDWIHLVTGPEGVIEHDLQTRRRLGRERVFAAGLEAQARARDLFQYRYEAIRVPDPAEADEHDPLGRFALLMATPETKALLGEIIGTEVGGFADGQATAYGPGDFLTLHDDAVEGKNRLAAFVYGLTPGWRLDWGGLLLFHGERGQSAEALAPRFNTLDLFGVPRDHSVTLVSHAAAHRRYAITGWLTA